ncbi:hypothetical protein GUITHDRAFT_112087 [Guillardia theta CCMP2712]|uniref:Thiamine phosphate synthase/TenI domain-containing protein n=1 Tax=Guillardia theta (strain CCMP2712) TaxID=905079 RepID=L1J1J3_GUITC|nr:hypothetical protein GUITHDRAFT_112087 [Guillardia theta CCMP2712]EKX41955.1 hypothetical protein GUITHDRAFT_112087 [Guillardia theta CCMP2712]|eukprot:XP_005828935.1 hypothetical protein GUITHDRAFT_112087 [Guillardia theta CCMP2712]
MAFTFLNDSWSKTLWRRSKLLGMLWARAAGAGVDYVLLGTIFRTDSHPEKVEVEGLKLIQEARESFPRLNLIGIGGINDRNCDQVMRSGANGVAVISYIFDAADAASAVRDMKARMLEGEIEREKRSSR